MAKEFFKNLPSQETPFNASRWNGILNGEESMGSIVVEDITCKNKFNKNSVLKGYELQSVDGSATTNSDWFVSDYIEVEPNKDYCLSGGRTIGTTNAFYDSEKNYLGHISALSGAITSLDNAKFVRFNGRLNELDRDIQFEEGSEATNYVEHKEFDNIAVDASIDELLSFLNGFYSPESSIKRIGNHYFGYVTIAKESKFTEAQEAVATLKKQISYSVNMYGVGGKSVSHIWSIPSGLTYIYVSNAGLYVKAPTDFEYVKFYLDITIE